MSVRALDQNEQKHRTTLIQHMKSLGQTASTETALFHQAAAATYGLDITSMKTLSILTQEGPQTAGELSIRLNLTTGAVTNVIDRLEYRSLVSRTPHAKDRRKVIIAVNKQKLAIGATVYELMGNAFEALLQQYTTEQLEFLIKYYQDTITLTQQQITHISKR